MIKPEDCFPSMVEKSRANVERGGNRVKSADRGILERTKSY